MNILFLTSRLPGRWQGDRLRAYHQLRILARTHRVTLLTFADSRERAQGLGAAAELCERVVAVPASPGRMAVSLARGGVAGRPLQVALYESAAMRAAIRKALHAQRYDVAHIQLVRMAPYLANVLPLPHVVDLVDALSLNMARRARHDRGLWRFIAGVEFRRLAPYERALAGSVDHALVSSRLDHEALGGSPRLSVVPNGVDGEEFAYARDGRQPDTVIFSGNLGYFPNVDAVLWLAEAILPWLERAAPGVRIHVVGARPHPRILRLARGQPRITVSPDVEHMAPYLRRAAVAVAPMRSGSGQQYKVLEAMACGTPVVATSLASSGIEACHAEHLLVADDPRALADHVVRVLRDPRLAADLAERARRLVEERYTWERSVMQLERLYRSVIDAHRR